MRRRGLDPGARSTGATHGWRQSTRAVRTHTSQVASAAPLDVQCSGIDTRVPRDRPGCDEKRAPIRRGRAPCGRGRCHPRRGAGPFARERGVSREIRDHGARPLPLCLQVEARGAKVPLRLRRVDTRCGRDLVLTGIFDVLVPEILGSEHRTRAFDARAPTHVEPACARDVGSWMSSFRRPRNESREPGNELRSPANERREPPPFARSPDLFARSPDLFARSPDLFARSPDLFARSPDLFARSRDLFARSPVPRLRSPAPVATVLLNERKPLCQVDEARDRLDAGQVRNRAAPG